MIIAGTLYVYVHVCVCACVHIPIWLRRRFLADRASAFACAHCMNESIRVSLPSTPQLAFNCLFMFNKVRRFQRSAAAVVVSAVIDVIDFISIHWCVRTFHPQANRRRVVTMPLRSGPAAGCSAMCWTVLLNHLQTFVFKGCLFPFCGPYVTRHKCSDSKQNATVMLFFFKQDLFEGWLQLT